MKSQALGFLPQKLLTLCHVQVLILLIISKSAIHDENYIPTYQTVLRSAIHLT